MGEGGMEAIGEEIGDCEGGGGDWEGGSTGAGGDW